MVRSTYSVVAISINNFPWSIWRSTMVALTSVNYCWWYVQGKIISRKSYIHENILPWIFLSMKYFLLKNFRTTVLSAHKPYFLMPGHICTYYYYVTLWHLGSRDCQSPLQQLLAILKNLVNGNGGSKFFVSHYCMLRSFTRFGAWILTFAGLLANMVFKVCKSSLSCFSNSYFKFHCLENSTSIFGNALIGNFILLYITIVFIP